MPATYEFWLSDDSGRRLILLKDLAFASFTRTVSGLGTIQCGLPFRAFVKNINPYFKPDWRIEVWRSPAYGVPLRNEDVFLLRNQTCIHAREDGMESSVLWKKWH
jgi:hypothetical protein